MYLCDRGIDLAVGVMYLCVRGIDLAVGGHVFVC